MNKTKKYFLLDTVDTLKERIRELFTNLKKKNLKITMQEINSVNLIQILVIRLYLIVVHAEYNAILSKGAPSFKGCTLYVTKYPCNVCAQLIVQSGISKVVYINDQHTPFEGKVPIPYDQIDPKNRDTMKPNSYLASQRILTKCLHKENVKSVLNN